TRPTRRWHRALTATPSWPPPSSCSKAPGSRPATPSRSCTPAASRRSRCSRRRPRRSDARYVSSRHRFAHQMAGGVADHDVVIVGAGAAGVSCALECFDIQLDTVVFETEGRAGGQLAEIPHSVRNVATGRFVDGPAVRDGLEAAATTLGPRLRVGEPVTAIHLAEQWGDAGGQRVHPRA